MVSDTNYYIGTIYYLKGDKEKAEKLYREVYFDLLENATINNERSSKN
jgi:Flp pilus assembly protein TadD